MKRIEIKIIRMPSGKYLCGTVWDGMGQTSKLSQAMTWYGDKEEIDIVKTAQDWGGKIVILREARDE